MTHLETFKLNIWHTIHENIKFKFLNSEHNLGSAFVLPNVHGKNIVFLGDIGRKEPILLPQYEYINNDDYVIIESTYGNRNHPNISITEAH